MAKSKGDRFVGRVIKLFKKYKTDSRFNTGDVNIDDHRRHAYANIDVMLEQNKITPEKAQNMKTEWDKRHGVSGGKA